MAGFVVSMLAGDCHAEEFAYESKGRRDPFIPLVTPDGRLLKLDTHTEEKTNLAVEGIIYDEGGLSYAMVGGFVVKVGDSLGDYRVLKIEPEKVVFIKDGVIEEAYLKKEEK